MAVGRVATDHHTVSLKVKSTLDSCDDDLMDEEAAVGGGCTVAQPDAATASSSNSSNLAIVNQCLRLNVHAGQ